MAVLKTEWHKSTSSSKIRCKYIIDKKDVKLQSLQRLWGFFLLLVEIITPKLKNKQKQLHVHRG